MKTLTKILTITLCMGLMSACAQSQDTNSETENEMMQQDNTASSQMDYSEKHKRGNQEARPSPNASVSQTIGTTKVKVSYSRPGVKGRTIFGDLEAYGERWRAGANEATTISFTDSVMIEGQSLAPGAYTLHTIPQENEWTIIFNSKFAWGTDYDESQDVLRVDVESEEAPAMEWFMIYFEDLSDTSAHMVLHWNETKVPVTIEI